MKNLFNTNDYPMYSKEEERKVVLTYKTSDDVSKREKAKENLCMHNMLLIYSVINKIDYSKEYVEDLVSYGIEGIIIALDKYDLNSENRFSTYAYNWIYKKIYDAYRVLSRKIGIPSDVYDDLIKFKKAFNTFKEKNGYCPSYDYYYESEMMKILCKNGDMGVNQYKKVVDAFLTSTCTSLDCPINSDSDNTITIADTVEDKRSYKDEVTYYFYEALENMEKELVDGKLVSSVIKSKVEGLSGALIAKKLNITRAVYRRIEKEGLDYLRNDNNLRECYVSL